MRLFGIAIGVLWVLAGCASEDTSPSRLGQACSVDNECVDPLICLQVQNQEGLSVGMCTINCMDNNQCFALDAQARCLMNNCTYACTTGGTCSQNSGECVYINASEGRCAP